MGRQTQLDQAIQSLEADIDALRRGIEVRETEIKTLQHAIERLMAKRTKAKTKSKPAAPKEGTGTS